MKIYPYALTLALSLFLTACSTNKKEQHALFHQVSKANVIQPDDLLATNHSPKNIIMVIADGMGPAYTTAYRFNDNPNTKIIEPTIFDKTLVGLSSTHPASISGFVTDSAAAATALSTGVKTYNGAIGIDVHKSPVQTVLEFAKLQSKKTGVVVTSQINHATPASYLTHNASRHNYNAIADSYLDEGIKADVYLGGGWQYFLRDDRNLVSEFIDKGFQYIDDFSQLSTLLDNTSTLGLFADKGLPGSLDDTNTFRLTSMSKAAIKQLENPQGYFLLIEASQIDWAGHSNDIASAMAEMHDLANTLQYLATYVNNNPDTLVVLTADHSTGGFTIGANGTYAWHPEMLRTMQRSPRAIAKVLSKNKITSSNVLQLLKIEVSAEELSILINTKAKAQQAVTAYQQLSVDAQQNTKQPNIETSLYVAINQLIDTRTNTGWTTGGHTGVDVPVHAFGQQSSQFNGMLDNTDIAKKLFKLLGKSQ
jgi:alkaline phosphatase